MPSAIIYIVVALLLVGLFPLPYGYYMLLRLVACGVFGFAAYIAFQRKYKFLPWVLGFMALLFNPIFTIHFSKQVWLVIDFIAALLLIVTGRKIRISTS